MEISDDRPRFPNIDVLIKANEYGPKAPGLGQRKKEDPSMGAAIEDHHASSDTVIFSTKEHAEEKIAILRPKNNQKVRAQQAGP